MAIKNLIARGIGFSPGSLSYIPTLGFSIGAAIVGPELSKFVHSMSGIQTINHDRKIGRVCHDAFIPKVIKKVN